MPEPIPFLDLQAQYRSIRGELDAAMARVIAHGQFILGPEVRELESKIAAFTGQPHGIGVASGTDAIVIALRALGIGPGDEVITTPFTFIATAEPILALGAKPVFADINPDTFNLDPARAAEKITPRTKAIIVVHLYGLPCDLDAFARLARERGLALLEDCAQSLGSAFRGRPCGGFGAVACHSFFPSKNLGCYGDGGMVCAADEALAESCRVLRHHGCKVKYQPLVPGYNSRLDTLQAAILLAKFPHLEAWLAARRERAARYIAGLKGRSVVTPVEPAGCRHSYYAYTIRSRERDALQARLKSRGIPAMVYYPVPLHLTEVFKGLGHRPGDFPEAERAAREVLSLPIYPELADAQLDRIVEAIG